MATGDRVDVAAERVRRGWHAAWFIAGMRHTSLLVSASALLVAAAGCAPAAVPFDGATLIVGTLDDDNGRIVNATIDDADADADAGACPGAAADDVITVGTRPLPFSPGGTNDGDLFVGPFCEPLQASALFVPGEDDGVTGAFVFENGGVTRQARFPGLDVAHDVVLLGDATDGRVDAGDRVVVLVARGDFVVDYVAVGGLEVEPTQNGAEVSFVVPDLPGAAGVYVSGEIVGDVDDCDGFAACEFAGHFARTLPLTIDE